MSSNHQRGMAFSAAKPKDFKQAMKRLLVYSRKYLPVLIVTIIIAVIGTIFSIIGPNKLRDVADIITSGLKSGADIDLVKINRIGFLLITLYTLSALFNFIQGYIMAGITQKLSKNLRSDISGKINRLPLRYFDQTAYGDILSRVTNDVDLISQSLNQSVVNFVTSVIMFLGTLIMMYWINWILATVAILSTISGFVFSILIMKKSQKYFIAQQQDLGAINGHIEEIYSNHNVVKAYNGERAAKANFLAINKKLYDSGWKSQFLSGLMMPLMGFVGNFGYVAVSIVGAVLTHQGVISFGVIVAFMIYIRLFTNPLSQIAQVLTRLQQAAAASERVFTFFDEPELEDESNKEARLENVKGKVEFLNVRFGYKENQEIIHNFSAIAYPGQKIAIVGPTGAGKTTLVNLLMRFYEVNAGMIKIDGVPTKDITRENVHELFSMVLQDSWLFEGTIKENIRYSKTDVTDEEIINACKAVGIDHFIRTLPNGYDTLVTDAMELSQGQKQLLTIARALVKNAPLLILDEATSSVDTRTEIQIQEAMDKLMTGRTSFIIAHRLSTIKNADLILVIQAGDIVESGRHEELLAQNGFYAELYNSQFALSAV